MRIYLLASQGISLTSRLIRWRQWGFPFTHIAHIGTELPENPQNPYVKEAWNNGYVEGFFKDTHTPGTKFRIYSYVVTPKQANKIEKYLGGLIGKKYDWLGIFGFLFYSKTIESSKRVFCSESEFAAPLKAGRELLRNTEPAEVSPALFLKSPLLKHHGDYVLE